MPLDEQEGLRRYVATLRERRWLILAVTVLTTLAAIVYVATAEKTYEAEATLLITPNSDSDLQSLGLISVSSDPTRDVQTASELVTTTAVADRVKAKLGFAGLAADLLEAVSAEPVVQSSIVAVTASESDPAEAADLANAFASEAVANRTDQMHKSINQMLPQLREQQRGTPSAENEQLISKYVGLQQADDPTLRVETPAVPPPRPSPRGRSSASPQV